MNRSMHAGIHRSHMLLNVGFAATMIVFVVIAILAYLSIHHYLSNSASVSQSKDFHDKLESVVSSLKDIQRGARGYVITGDVKFLEPFRNGTDIIKRNLETLQPLAALKTEQLRRLEVIRSLTQSMIDITRKEVEFVQSGEPDSAREAVRAGESKRAMDTVEKLANLMMSEEAVSLAERQAVADSDLKDTFLYLGLGSSLNFVLVIGIFIAMNGQARRQQAMAEKLQRSEQRLQTIINSVHEGITFSNAAGGFEVFNPRMKELTGYSMEEANRSGDFSRLLYPDPEDHQKALDGVRALIEEPGIHHSETTITAKSGTRKTLRISSQMLRGFDSKMFLTTYEDITEQHMAEAALRRAQEKYYGIVQNAAEGIYQSTLEGAIQTANPAMARIFGYSSPEKLMGAASTGLSQFYVDSCRRAKFIRQVNDHGSVSEFESLAYRMNGDVIWISENARGILDAEGKLSGFEGTVVDITRRKKAEEMIRLDSEIMKGLSEGVYLIRANDGIIVHTNPKFDKMFGYEPGELINKHVSVVNAATERSPQEIVDAISQMLRERGSWEGETYNIRKDGTTFWCNANVSTFEHPEYGEVWIAVHADITERRSAEAERERIITELHHALADIKTLSGLVPICSHCKKIRDDAGYWTKLESYIQQRTSAHFSHGICPDCMKEFYPEFHQKEGG